MNQELDPIIASLDMRRRNSYSKSMQVPSNRLATSSNKSIMLASLALASSGVAS